MKALRQLGFLKLSLRPEGPPEEEDQRVVALFRNRAELKKAYGDLRVRAAHRGHGDGTAQRQRRAQ